MIRKFEELNYYELLQIPFNASSFEVRQAYKSILSIYEDGSLATYSLFSDDERMSILHRIEKAFLTLTDNKKRDEYDHGLVERGDLSEEMLAKALDPFFTTRTTRRIGLGLSLLREASRRCEGHFDIQSQEGKGTEVRVSFQLGHIDRAPLGDIAGSLTSLIMGSPDVAFVYTHRGDQQEFQLDTREVKEALDGLPIQTPEVMRNLTDMIRDAVAGLYGNNEDKIKS